MNIIKSIKSKIYRYLKDTSNSKSVIYSKIDSDTIIGDYSYIGVNCSITKANIGRYVSIANNVAIGQGEHLINEISTNSIFYKNKYQILTQKDVNISDDVWLGVNSVVLRGVSIGRGAIIGAGAVVTKDIPPYAIAVGVPAKVLKYRFSNKQIEDIEKSKWWKYEVLEAKQILVDLKND